MVVQHIQAHLTCAPIDPDFLTLCGKEDRHHRLLEIREKGPDSEIRRGECRCHVITMGYIVPASPAAALDLS